jgi:hypothetical protein
VTPYALVDIYFLKKTAASMMNDGGERRFFENIAKYPPDYKLYHCFYLPSNNVLK